MAQLIFSLFSFLFSVFLQIIDKYINVKRDEIHRFDKEAFSIFKSKHLRATECLALYLHTENESEVARQHLHLASKASGGNIVKQLSAIKQASLHLREFDELSDTTPV